MGERSGLTLKNVTYAAKQDVIVLNFQHDRVVSIPRRAIGELRNLSGKQLRNLHPDNAGLTLSQRQLDIDIYVSGLLVEVFGIQPSALLGKKGGAKTSRAKRRAAQENGRRGGRPRKKRGVVAS